jgi:hypothetical protein
VSFAGTPAYMAPECLGGEAATSAADQYALAATLVEVITGKRPFAARTYWALHEVARTKPPRLDGVPKRYHAALSRALHPDPVKRYASIVDFASALVKAPPFRGGAVIAAAIVPALVVGAGWWWTTRDKPSTAASIERDAAIARDADVVALAPTVPIAPVVVDAAAGDVSIDASVAVQHTREKRASSRGPTRESAREADPVDASVAPEPARPIVETAPPVRTCASAEECRTTWMRCKAVAAARMAPLDQVRKRGWAECSAANTACKTNNGVACSSELTRCNAAVAADYERGSERVQQEDERCLEARNECLACK